MKFTMSRGRRLSRSKKRLAGGEEKGVTRHVEMDGGCPKETVENLRDAPGSYERGGTIH